MRGAYVRVFIRILYAPLPDGRALSQKGRPTHRMSTHTRHSTSPIVVVVSVDWRALCVAVVLALVARFVSFLLVRGDVRVCVCVRAHFHVDDGRSSTCPQFYPHSSSHSAHWAKFRIAIPECSAHAHTLLPLEWRDMRRSVRPCTCACVCVWRWNSPRRCDSAHA